MGFRDFLRNRFHSETSSRSVESSESSDRKIIITPPAASFLKEQAPEIQETPPVAVEARDEVKTFHVKQEEHHMGRILAVVNQKGGVGKTTTAINLSSSLAAAGKKVLLVDSDPQGNATSGLGVDKSELDGCVYDMLVEDRPLESILVKTQIRNLDMLPATIDLAGAEIELVAALSRESKLKRHLMDVKDQYDYIMVDSPPSLGLLTLNALTAADGVLVPIQCEYYALEGITQLLNTVKLVQRHLNPALEIFGVVLTMFDPRTNLAQQVAAEVREYFQERAFQTIIPRNIRLGEAPSHGLPISLYDPKSRGAESYEELAKEVIERG